MEKNFLEIHKEHLETLGFWDELNKKTLIRAIERIYRKEVVVNYQIVDIVNNNDNCLIKWHKRIAPLSDSEYNSIYGLL